MGTAVLSKNEILRAAKKGEIAVTPFDAECVGPCSVDLRLGNEFKVFAKKKGTKEVKDAPDAIGRDAFKRVVLRGGETLSLKPGELVLGVTKERVRLSKKYCAVIDGRSRFARIGLLVHVSSSLIQPNCDNVQVLEIANLSPFTLKLKPGLRVCQVVFHELSSPAEYKGGFRLQKHP